MTYLPPALESTLSLLVAMSQDSSSSPSPLALRQSYSIAIIRLVNGLVDPLQLGAYARSIASIAHQLNLPLWLVELRHAATHEDLPSIELLREAAREVCHPHPPYRPHLHPPQSMTWLLYNYFLPTLNPSSVSDSHPTLRPLAPILQRYKSILKITTRDTSLKSQYKDTLLSTMKEIERWISEAQVAANVLAGDIGWEATPGENEMYIDSKEKWALERICDALLDKGALVPLSKKYVLPLTETPLPHLSRKRDFPVDAFHPPKFSVLLWTPLLHHVQSLHPEFLALLVDRMMSTLVAKPQCDESYEMCLARWVLWCIETQEEGDSVSGLDLRKETTASLMQSMGYGCDSKRDRKAYV